jgi:hypothetical protein
MRKSGENRIHIKISAIIFESFLNDIIEKL